MVLDKLKEKLLPQKKAEEPAPEYQEFGENAFKEESIVRVRIESLNGFADTERIQDMVRNGSVVFLKIKDLRQKDITELKKSVDKLRKTTVAMDGDIVGVDEDMLIITPSFAKIYRGKAG